MGKNTEISARVSKIIEHLGVNANSFAKVLNYDRSQTVYDIVSGKVAPSYDFFNRFANSEYSEVFSMTWLISGQGEMLTSCKKVATATEDTGGIPLVEIEAVGGFGNDDFSILDKDIVAHYSIPDFTEAAFMIRVRGNSMAPHYNSGDLVACKVLKESQFIQWNEVHVIATREQGILIKRLRKSDDGEKMIAISDNPDYPPFEVPNSEITGIALVLGGIRLE